MCLVRFFARAPAALVVASGRGMLLENKEHLGSLTHLMAHTLRTANRFLFAKVFAKLAAPPLFPVSSQNNNNNKKKNAKCNGSQLLR